jgi:hypothetical protein
MKKVYKGWKLDEIIVASSSSTGYCCNASHPDTAF